MARGIGRGASSSEATRMAVRRCRREARVCGPVRATSSGRERPGSWWVDGAGRLLPRSNAGAPALRRPTPTLFHVKRPHMSGTRIPPPPPPPYIPLSCAGRLRPLLPRGSQTASMPRVIAIANQKGGVGKTTTAINLGASLAVAEKRTLVVDIDPQGNASSGLGVRDRDGLPSIYDILVEGHPAEEAVIRSVHFPFLDLVPSNRDLVGAEIELVGREGRERVLRTALEPLRQQYDYILVDCPPSLGLLTLNTLTASDAVLIPIQCEFYALEGLSQLLNTIRLVQRGLNTGLDIEGVLLTMFDRRLNLSRQVAEEAREYFGNRVFRSTIPRNVRLAEAPSFGQPIVHYDVLSAGAQSYLSLARELIARNGGEAAGRGRTRREATRS